jgi:hypothetical protein
VPGHDCVCGGCRQRAMTCLWWLQRACSEAALLVMDRCHALRNCYLLQACFSLVLKDVSLPDVLLWALVTRTYMPLLFSYTSICCSILAADQPPGCGPGWRGEHRAPGRHHQAAGNAGEGGR